MMLATVVALAGSSVLRRQYGRAGWWAIPAVFVAVVFPLAAFPIAGMVLVAVQARRLRLVRAARVRVEFDAIALGELTALGLTSGLTFMAALERAGDELGPPLRDEVVGIRRRSRHVGAAAALEQADGVAQRLYLLAARATITGAPVADAVRAYVVAERDVQRATALAAARRLPVQLLLPLALLILPGFMVLTVGTALVGAAQRLGL